MVGAGGSGTDEAALSSADIYDPATDTWRALPNLNVRDGGREGVAVRFASQCAQNLFRFLFFGGWW